MFGRSGRLDSAQPYALGLFRIGVGLLFACPGAVELGTRVAAFVSSGAFGPDRLSTRRTRARAAQPTPVAA